MPFGQMFILCSADQPKPNLTPETLHLKKKNTPWKRKNIHKPLIVHFHVSFWGCIYHHHVAALYTVIPLGQVISGLVGIAVQVQTL